MDPRCRVEMLGPLRLVKDDQVVTRFGAKKTAALLAYLALRPGPQPREQILDLFWPDMDLAAGRNNLSYTLTCLRRLVEPAGVRKGSVLVTNHASVGFDALVVSTDVAEFETLLKQTTSVEILERAVSLWRGDPFVGMYDDWAVREAERLQMRWVETLDRLASDFETVGRFADAADISHRRLAADPYAEEPYLDLMRCQVLAGQITFARETRRKFEQLIRDEFGTELSPETLTRIEAIFSQSSTSPSLPTQAPIRSVAKSRVIPEAEVNALTSSTLPFWLSRFFGRESEMAQLAELLLSAKADLSVPDLPEPPCSLVTLVGPGGTGKTRLASEFGRQVATRLGHWCGFVGLADLTGTEQITSHIATSLKISLESQGDPLEQICDFLRNHARSIGAPLLLILDNLEHVLGADGQSLGAIVQSLLNSTPELSILCTSRRRIGLQGERILPIGALPIPESEELAAMSRLSSVRLYVDRAQSVRPDFALTATNAPAVAGLCQRLEGSPLALELAASWVRLLPPRKMWERLNAGQRLPEGRTGDLPERHRSLSAALDWSWRLLTEPQRRLLARLSVFRGGWDLSAIETVAHEPNALELLADLQDASLVTVQEDENGDVRYRLLVTICEYASDRLTEYGEQTEIQERHRDYYLTRAEDASQHLFGPDRMRWYDLLETEHDNFRTAMQWCLTVPNAIEEGMRIASAIWPFWRARGHTPEGRQWMARHLERSSDGPPASVRAQALIGAGNLAMEQSDYAKARPLYEESLAIRRLLGDEEGVAKALNNLGVIMTDQGEYETAQQMHTEALAIRQRSGDESGAARSMTNLARSIEYRGDRAAARPFYEEALAIRRRLNDEAGMADSLSSLGGTLLSLGHPEAARALHTEALEINQRGDYEMGVGLSLTDLGQDAEAMGEYELALRLYRDSIVIWERKQHPFGVGHVADCASSLAMQMGQITRAVRLHAAADAIRRSLNCATHIVDRQDIEEMLTSARASLGDTAYAVAWAEGAAMPVENIIADVLGDMD